METRSPSSSGTKRLAVIAPSAAHLVRLRGSLIADALSKGIAVLAMAPDLGPAAAGQLISLGAEPLAFMMRVPGFQMFPRLRARRRLTAALKNWRPDAVLISGTATATFAMKAARAARISKRVLIVSDIPNRKADKDLQRALRRAQDVIVHNKDDFALLATSERKSRSSIRIVDGAGANIRLEPPPMPGMSGPIVFAAASRLDPVKGAQDFLAAARIAIERGSNARFILAGPEGTSAEALTASNLSAFANQVQYLGDLPDLAPLFSECHVFVCPSKLEGMPHAAQLAMAAGRPIIATDVPGARDTVDENINGTLVPAARPEALAEAFARMVDNGHLLAAMGRASRAKAQRLFDAQRINAELLAVLGFI